MRSAGLRSLALVICVGALVVMLVRLAGIVPNTGYVKQLAATDFEQGKSLLETIGAQYIHNNNKNIVLNLTNISYNISGRAVLFCNSSTYATLKLLYKGNASGVYVVAANDILRYVYGTKLENIINKKLHGARWVMLAAKCGLREPLDVERKGPTILIYVKAKNCIAHIPVIVDIYGKVHIKRINNSYFVDMKANASMPLDVDARRLFSLIDASCIPRQIALRLFEGSTVVLHDRWVVNPKDASSLGAGSSNGRYIVGWETPLLILFPKNANELKKIIKKELKIKYLNISLRFSMINISVIRTHYGEPSKQITVPVIKAVYVDHEFYTALHRAILPLTQYPFKLNVSVPIINGKPFERLIGANGDLSTVYNIIVNVLVNNSIDINGYRNNYMHASIYRVILPEPEEPPSLLYRYVYPISFNYFPMILSINSSKFLLAVKADAIYPPWFDPYAINIGFYKVRSQSRCPCDIFILILLVAIVASTALIIYAKKRGRSA